MVLVYFALKTPGDSQVVYSKDKKILKVLIIKTVNSSTYQKERKTPNLSNPWYAYKTV